MSSRLRGWSGRTRPTTKTQRLERNAENLILRNKISAGLDQELREISDFLVDLRSLFEKLAALLMEPGFERMVFIHSQAGGVIADVLSDLHGAEVGPAHAAEVRDLRSILG